MLHQSIVLSFLIVRMSQSLKTTTKNFDYQTLLKKKKFFLEKDHFSHLYLQFGSYGHHPELVTGGEGGNVDWRVIDSFVFMLSSLLSLTM